ncbi:exodeoxyribonuclease VII large subunit, partial [Neorhizobium sp. SHOUNA12B]
VVKRRSFERASSGLRLELLTNRLAQQRQLLADRLTRGDRCLERQLLKENNRVAKAGASLSALPARLLGQLQRERLHLTSMARHADTAISHTLIRSRAAITAQDRVLQSLSYKNVLKRGFAVVRGEDDRPLTRAAGIGEGQAISVEFADGRITAVTGEGGELADPPVAAPQPKKRPAKPEPPGGAPKQGTLF